MPGFCFRKTGSVSPRLPLKPDSAAQAILPRPFAGSSGSALRPSPPGNKGQGMSVAESAFSQCGENWLQQNLLGQFKRNSFNAGFWVVRF